MARQSNIKLSITTDNLIFYKRLGEFYIRTKPVRVKQTKATKAKSTDFGKASRLARGMRNILSAAIPNPKDKSMQNRLNKAVYQCILTGTFNNTEPVINLPFITGFNFNEQTALADRLRIPILVSVSQTGELMLYVPAFTPTEAIKAPAHTAEVKLCIAAGKCSVTDGVVVSQYTTQTIIPYTNSIIPEQTIQLPVCTTPGCIAVTGIMLQYRVPQQNGNSLYTVTDKRWTPAAIIDARYN